MPAPESPLTWTDDGQPRSRLFGDVYFSAEDGLAESRAVFLQGCGLPDAWSDRQRFVVGELGFGTGLNVAALLELWSRTREPGAQLHIFSIEGYPITREEAARALARWPELDRVTEPLLDRWPGQARGLHRVDLPELDAVLDLAVLDVAQALEGWSGRADAWFLDGFSPALNPDMWRDEVLALVGARSAPGARAATFTVAGQVRRGLAAAGFEVAKAPGFGRKRERLEARREGRPTPLAAPTVAIVGGGIAGAAAARALRKLGLRSQVFDGDPRSGASNNPAALVTPRLDVGGGPPSSLFAQAFRRACDVYAVEVPEALIASGVLQLAGSERDRERFAKIAASDLFEPHAMTALSQQQATGWPGQSAAGGLAQHTALTVEPEVVLRAWRGAVRREAVTRLERTGERWRLIGMAGETLAEVDAVILAAAQGVRPLRPDVPLTPVRGQASWAAGETAQAAAWGGYIAPTRDGVLFGATHDRNDEGLDVREADHARNLATLGEVLPDLAQRLSRTPLEGRAGVRATTPDRLPVAGELEPGLFLLTGFGSRGFTFAPLLAEHVAAQIARAPSPLPSGLAALVEPQRFARRAARRSHS